MYLVIVFRERQKENSDIFLNVGIPVLFPMSILCFPTAKIGNVFRTGNFLWLKKIKAACVRAAGVLELCPYKGSVPYAKMMYILINV